MVTSVFLLIYALLSPVGGFLADRYSRRLMILCSLVVWSVVTWWTGHAEDYTSLLIARGAMGISEAFYIPAALALITDYHRGSTRSIATGLHMSGIYVGMAVAGFGATMASWTGWRMTFALFGLIGVAYAVILILFLKDPSKAPADTAQAKKPSVPEKKTVLLNVDNDEQAIKEPSSKLSTGAVLSSLLSGRPMWMLLAVVAFAGAGNWFLLTWYPTLLQDKYQLSSAEAGPAATLWSSVAKYVAVLGGAILADMWYRRNARARALVPGITFTISGPLVVLALLPGIFGWDITVPLVLMLGLVATQGLAQGSLDATLMPVLRSHIDERYSATGYGLLNLTSAGVGAPHLLLWGMVQGSGRSADHHPGGGRMPDAVLRAAAPDAAASQTLNAIMFMPPVLPLMKKPARLCLAAGTLFALFLTPPCTGAHLDQPPREKLEAEFIRLDGQKAVLNVPAAKPSPFPSPSSPGKTGISSRNRKKVGHSPSNTADNYHLPWPRSVKCPDNFKVETIKEEPGEYIYETPHFRFICDAKLGTGMIKRLGLLFEATHLANNKTLPIGNSPCP